MADASNPSADKSSDLWLPDIAMPDLRATTKWEAISEIMECFAGHPEVEDMDAWKAEIIRREKLSPTILKPNVAMPHARTAAVNKIVWAMAFSKAGIPFQRAGARVHLVVLVGVPSRMVRQYLDFLGRLSGWLRAGSAREMPPGASEGLMAVLRGFNGRENQSGVSAS